MTALKLQVIFSALDKITGPLKKIFGESTATAKALKATSDRLKELNSQQKNIGQFRELHAGLAATTSKLQAAQQRIAGLSHAMQQTATPTRAMTREFNAAVRAAGALKNTQQQQSQQLQILRDRLSGAGISTRNLGQHERTLRNEISATNAQLGEQQKRLAALAARQQRIAGARQHAGNARAVAGNAATAGVGATTAGTAMAMPLYKGLQEAKHYELEMVKVRSLGLGDDASNKAITFAKNMKTYGTSAVDNLTLVRDAMSVFADEHHAEMVAPTLAKMKFSNQAIFGEEKGADNERKFMDMLKVIELRGGLASKAEFIRQANIVQKVITATGGRVGPNEWLNVIKTGGIAAKGISDEAFYYQMEPLVQEMGGHRVGTSMMSAYQNIYQGRTTKRSALKLEEYGLIADQGKVKHDKAGQISYLNPGALMGSDLFRVNQFAWMEQVLLPQLAKKGITEKQQVLDAMGSMFSNRTASNLFAQMYLQREQIHKNAKLNAGADGIDALDDKAKKLPQGQELEVIAKLGNLKLALGDKILPMYVRGIEMLTDAVKGLNTFMEANPATAKVMIVSFTILAGILVVLGPLMLMLATLIGPYAMLYLMFAKMGVHGGVLIPILRSLGSGFMMVGKALLWMGRALLMNPIGLLITAIAVAAYLIYRNWEPISQFFATLWAGVSSAFSSACTAISGFVGSLWSSIATAFSGGIGGIAALILNWSPLGLFYQAFASVMSWFGIDLPAKFSEFGANILQGLVNGITGSLGWVKDKVMGAGESVIGWFKEKLGIHSPSRVFAQLGDYTMEGLAIGIARGQNDPLMQVSGLAKRLTQLGAGIAIGAAALPAMAFDTRPPVTGTGGAQSIAYDSHDNIQIIIQPAPGMDPQAIARAVSAELDRRERDKIARTRSSLHDY